MVFLIYKTIISLHIVALMKENITLKFKDKIYLIVSIKK